ncbi:MAG: hypothetical protein ACHP65_00235 [Legionellales bacterium]
MPSSALLQSNRSYYWLLGMVCLTYLVLQWCLISYGLFSKDDFWLAYHLSAYKSGLPYRDFTPYKSVLGYYVFLLPMVVFHGVITPLLFTKAWIALLNASFLFGAAVVSKKYFSKAAILTTLVILIFTPTFFAYSAEIRVDLLAYWLCLISVLLVFDKKHLVAGILLGLGFLICQKAVFYFIASNLGFVGLFVLSNRSLKMLKNVVYFNMGVFLTVFFYVVFWSCYSNMSVVLKSLFYEPYLLFYGVDWYAPLRAQYWAFIITNSYVIVLLWPLTFIGLLILPAKNKIFILLYSLVLLFFTVSNKQPFYYYPIAAVPAIFIHFSAFFSAFYARYYVATTNKAGIQDASIFMLALAIMLTAAIASSQFVINLPKYSGRYQKSIIHLMDQLLTDGDGYIAGVPLLLDKEQPVPGLKHLVGPSIGYMTHPSEKLRAVLTSDSQYLTPVTVPLLIESIKKAPVKFYVDNNRFHFLPKAIHRYLDTQYQHFWGSIFLYAPKIQAGQQSINIKFSGDYEVDADAVVSIDNKQYAPKSIITLARQQYVSDSGAAYRLKLIPNQVKGFLEPNYQKNQWKIMLY